MSRRWGAKSRRHHTHAAPCLVRERIAAVDTLTVATRCSERRVPDTPARAGSIGVTPVVRCVVSVVLCRCARFELLLTGDTAASAPKSLLMTFCFWNVYRRFAEVPAVRGCCYAFKNNGKAGTCRRHLRLRCAGRGRAQRTLICLSLKIALFPCVGRLWTCNCSCDGSHIQQGLAHTAC